MLTSFSFTLTPVSYTHLTTEDPTVSRMTIATVSDDETFEQIKKQLNRMVEVIKVIDFTDVFVRMKEILYIKVKKCTAADKVELFQIAETFKARVIDYGKDSLLLEFVQTATKNDAVIKLIKEEFKNIEAVSYTHLVNLFFSHSRALPPTHNLIIIVYHITTPITIHFIICKCIVIIIIVVITFS